MSELRTEHALRRFYHSEITDQITRDQVGVLYYREGFRHWSEQEHMREAYARIDAADQRLGFQREYIDVRTGSDKVVGTGCLRYGDQQGELCCLAVLPDFCSRGIGKWLIAERVHRAQELGLKVLYIEQLARTNTLVSYYTELGFEQYDSAEVPELFKSKPNWRQRPSLVLPISL